MNFWPIYALFSAFFAACVAILAKKGFADNIDSTLATTIRTLIMSIFLITISILFGKTKLIGSVNLKAFTYIALSAIAGAISWLFYFLALNNAPTYHVTTVAAIDRFSIVFVAILAVIFFGDSISVYSISGIFLIIFGTLLLSFK